MKRVGRQVSAVKPVFKEQGDLADPKMNELRETFFWAVQNRDTSIFRRSRLNFESRYCVWPNQSDDGRKWTPRRGEDQVFPWKGASDARVPLVDMYVNKDVSFLNILGDRMRPTVSATESNNAGFATTATQFLRWMHFQQMTEVRAEKRLLNNYLMERGVGVMQVMWDRRMQLGYEEIDLERIITNIMSQQNNPQMDRRLLDLPKMLMNPAYDKETLKLAQEIYPDVEKKFLAPAIVDLRETGQAKFPRPYLMVNRPRLRALAPNEDVFLPPEMSAMDDTREVHVRELLTETRLRDRIKSYEWDKDFVKQVIATQRGRITYGEEFQSMRGPWLIGSRQWQNYERMFEILHSFRRLTDENGVPTIYYTCWNAGITESWAYHDLLNYEHGEMPFVLFEREKRSRRVDDSRGYGEVASTWQNQIKAGWDQRIDRGSIATLPPSFYPEGMQPERWGPGVQVPTSQPTRYGFFQPPQMDEGGKEQDMEVRQFADEYFSRSKNPADMPENQLGKQDLGNNYMDGMTRVHTQEFALCQQFMPDDFYYRVTGDQKGRTIHAERDEIQGKFEVGISMDVNDLDADKAQEKVKSLGEWMAMDVNGRIDRDAALVYVGELIDPSMVARLLKPGEEAAQQEVDDEKTVFVKAMAGVPTDIKPGQAFQLRLQTLTQMLQQNQQAQQLYHTNDQVKEAFDGRIKQLQLQVDQQQNAVTGRGGPNFAPKTLSAKQG